MCNTIQVLAASGLRGTDSTEVINTIGSTEVFDDLKKVTEVNPNTIQQYFTDHIPNIIAFGFQILQAVIVYVIGVQIIRFIRKFVRHTLEKRDADTGVKQFLDALTKAICYFILIAMILSIFGIATTSALAVLGSAGLAVGLALQGSLANFAGGVLILMLKPFKVGDYIIEDSHKNEGTVHEISLIYTKLQTVDNKMIVIPNGTLANASLTNVTQSDKRRIDLFVGVSYQADLKKTKEVIKKVIMDEPNRLPDEEVDVFVSDLEDSSVKIGIRLWVATEAYWETRWRLLEEIKNVLDENGIEIPFPQLDVKVKE